MSANFSLMQERFNEIAATAALAQISKRLNELAVEPSSKRFARNRAAALEAWGELASLAERRMAAAGKPVAAVKRAAKPRVTTPTPPDTNTTATAAA